MKNLIFLSFKAQFVIYNKIYLKIIKELKFANGKVYEGNFINDKRYGQGVIKLN